MYRTLEAIRWPGGGVISGMVLWLTTSPASTITTSVEDTFHWMLLTIIQIDSFVTPLLTGHLRLKSFDNNNFTTKKA